MAKHVCLNMHAFIYMQYVHVRKNVKCRMRLLKLLTQSCLRNLKEMNVRLYVHNADAFV